VKGKDSISIATTLNNIGLVCDAQNNYPKALEYYEKCLEINQKAKGKDNVDTAPTLNNIGECFKNQADYVQALEYYS
jgi:tetratricopeptide (TPR) repeat protein